MLTYSDELDSLVFGVDQDTILTEEFECEDIDSILQSLNLQPNKGLPSEKD